MDLNKKRENIEDKLISTLFHPHETVYERHAREQKSKQFLGEGVERLATVYVPGVFFYKSVKEMKQRNIITTKSSLLRKAGVYAVCLGFELFLDGVKVGMGYTLYELTKPLYQ
ncbi:MAG: hypothetical protein Q8R37_00255 [Nanoarchaeota archaeon]|nr:hypothetical protein [Nanoarchaeota archaeon]